MDFEKLKTLAPCTGRYVKMMPVNEVSGYRKFGGCLDAYMDAYLLVQCYVNFSIVLAKYDGDIKTKRENHKNQVAIHYRTVTYLYI